MFRFLADNQELLEDIYELTYKYQMLKQEQERGDYGLPTILPDRAYMHFENIKHRLEDKLEYVYHPLLETYDWWIAHHEPDESELQSEAVERFESYVNYMGLSEAANYFGEDVVLDVLEEFVRDKELIYIPEEKENNEEGEDQIAYWKKYIESLPKQSKFLGLLKAQQQELFKELPETINPNRIKPLEEWELQDYTEIWDAWESEIKQEILERIDVYDHIDDRMEQIKDEYYEITALGAVSEMRDRLAEEYPSADLDEKILLFQEALTTAHNNGEMSEFFLETYKANDILNSLSSGPQVQEWNRELSSLLGYDVGSRMRSDAPTWYTPAFKTLAKAILLLNV